MRDLQRLAPDVLAGVLPRVYPQMLRLAYEHQDAGRPVYICTAAAQELAELLADVLGFDGAVGARSEIVDGLYTGRPAGRSPTARARRRRCASSPRARGSTSPSRGPTRTPSPTCRCCARRPPGGRQPRRELARVAREEGWEVAALRAARPPPEAAGAARRRGCRDRRRVVRRRRSRGRSARRARADEPARAHRRAARDPRRSRAASPTRRSRRTPRRGTASTASRASSSPQLGELGLMGVCVPDEHGGAGADFLSYVLVLEELSRADAGVGVTVAVHTAPGTLPILAHGTPRAGRAARAAARAGRGARRRSR